ncbi:MAG: endopeptidase La [Saprospiraceae bacterium]|nr:endopeptidase La [Saprospiraceae bacterium]
MSEDVILTVFGEDAGGFPMISVDEEQNDVPIGDVKELPLLPLRNTVLFPGVVVPISVGREQSLAAVEEAYKNGKLLAVVTQKDEETSNPEIDDVYRIGAVAKIIKRLQMPDGGVTVIVQGKGRFHLDAIEETKKYQVAKFTPLPDPVLPNSTEFKAVVDSVRETSMKIVQLSPNLPSEANIAIKNIDTDDFLLNFVASNLNEAPSEKQKILELENYLDSASQILGILDKELQLLEIKSQIQDKVRSDIDEQQRNYFLNQQLKTIQEELGENGNVQDIEELSAKAAKKQWNDNVREIFEKGLKRLQRLNSQSPEYGVQLNYMELMVELPWDEFSEESIDIQKAAKILDRDHYGLDKVKDRILEYLAVLKLKGDMKSPILCFAGPPGVGKTSLGKSIAEALGREYIRMSLGGLHDESEIRGHRRTYIGAMPGRIIQSMKKVGTSNPVIVLDEIDKVGKDFRGDPSSALLEVLDPEQNTTFHDNYLDVDYDLSKVLFVATANSLNTIQPALRDRMEIIHVSGYSVEEKVQIAKKHLLKKQREGHGLKATQITIRDKALEQLITAYTRESGVRGLDRELASVMRYSARLIASEEVEKVSVKPADLLKILGPTKFDKEALQKNVPPGVAVGLAWTSVGGDILYIESVRSPGKGGLQLTGNLGDVMKESAKTALSFLKSHATEIGINVEDMKQWDVHIHVPEGAIPKDGPSAGITMLSTLASLFSGRPVRNTVAMTGEITLRGKVLPVGGIKEKILAAKRAGISEIILCDQNKKHIEEIDDSYLKGLTFHYVNDMMEVLEIALTE